MKTLTSVLSIAAFLMMEGCTGQSTLDKAVQSVEPVVAALGSNVLYVGLDNPLAIAVPGMPCIGLKVLSDNGEVVGDSCAYSIHPKAVGMATIRVSGTTTAGEPIQGTVHFRVRDVPLPVPFIAGRTRQDGTVQREALEKSRGLILKLADFNFDVLYKVSHFEVSILSTEQSTRRYASQSWEPTEEMRSAFHGLKAGEAVLIHDIRAVGPSGEVHIEDLYLVVQ